ncbi:hypothetical protein KA005_19080 [bacterium]|nr:hypothetical protein [bacterium]
MSFKLQIEHALSTTQIREVLEGLPNNTPMWALKGGFVRLEYLYDEKQYVVTPSGWQLVDAVCAVYCLVDGRVEEIPRPKVGELPVGRRARYGSLRDLPSGGIGTVTYKYDSRGIKLHNRRIVVARNKESGDYNISMKILNTLPDGPKIIETKFGLSGEGAKALAYLIIGHIENPNKHDGAEGKIECRR